MSFISILWRQQSWNRERKIQYLKTVKWKIPQGRKSELAVSCQGVINPFCGSSVIFCGFISNLIGRETINIPEIFSSVHGFMGKTVNYSLNMMFVFLVINLSSWWRWRWLFNDRNQEPMLSQHISLQTESGSSFIFRTKRRSIDWIS